MKAFSHLKTGGFYDCHVQGIAVDKEREYMYFSFTTCLIKTDLQGKLIGSVKGIVGHLGCLAYNKEDGRVYGSLEYKNDSIGKGIMKTEGSELVFNDSFYIVAFDCDKITRPDMDAEKDGIMTAVYLKEVVDDYNAPGHKYGCSGIDGVTFAPSFSSDKRNCIYVAYGIYSDKKRKDNDYQVILCYDAETLFTFAQCINQNNLHQSGPEAPDDKYFVYTGNTTYGIQNLEYDKENNCLFAAVYKGCKLRFPNYSMYAIDMKAPPVKNKLKGLDETGKTLALKYFPFFRQRGKICGCNFPFGSTGMISTGNGNYLFSEDFSTENGNGTEIYSYRLIPDKGFVKQEILL